MRSTVEGEDIDPEDCNEIAGWKIIAPRASRTGKGACLTKDTTPTGTPPPQASNGKASTVRKSIVRQSKMPPLPEDDIKIIIRIRGGLNIARLGITRVADAITTAACIETSGRENDIICPNLQQNIVVVSTPLEENATKYATIRDIIINDHTHEVAAYRAAPHETCKGVIRNIPLSENEDALNRKIVNAHNPLALAAKRIKETNTVVIAFDGYKVPNYIRYGNALIRCALYRKQIDNCYACGRLGHRADVCPSPDEPICRGCGTPNPTEAHNCTPQCSLCGEEHITAGKECRQRFQLPYVVRKRRIEKRATLTSNQGIQESTFWLNEQHFPELTQSQPSSGSVARGRSGSRHKSKDLRGSSRSQSRGPRSRSRGPNKDKHETKTQFDVRGRTNGPHGHVAASQDGGAGATWAQRLQSQRATEVGSVAPPERDNNSDTIKRLEHDNLELRKLVVSLMDEIKQLRASLAAPAKENNSEIETMDIPVVEQASNPAKRKASSATQHTKAAKARADNTDTLDKLVQNFAALMAGQNKLIEQMEHIRGTVADLDQRVRSMETNTQPTEISVVPNRPPTAPLRQVQPLAPDDTNIQQHGQSL